MVNFNRACTEISLIILEVMRFSLNRVIQLGISKLKGPFGNMEMRTRRRWRRGVPPAAIANLPHVFQSSYLDASVYLQHNLPTRAALYKHQS
jgi:hypothetical protein